jgi:uncharacterized protein (TIGR02145 family)
MMPPNMQRHMALCTIGHAVNTKKLCPAGWHVPTDSEWTTLITNLGGENEAGGKLKNKEYCTG